jgi:hypothetical protein
MRYSLRLALAAILTVVSAGTTFGQIGSPSAFVQFNPGSLTAMQAGSPSALVLSSVTIYPGAQMDLTSGGMVVDAQQFNYYAPNGSGGYALETGTVAINDAIANMFGSPIQGQGGVTGDQTNGIFSSANVGGANPGYIGFAENSNLQYNTWRGINLNESQVTSMGDPTLIGYAYAGDLYMEGYSDPGDLGVVAGNITDNNTNTSWLGGDIYYEGYADPGDLGVVAGNITDNPAALYPIPSALGGPVSAPSAAISAVPEPGSVSLVIAGIGFIAILSRRRVAR